MKVFKEKFNKNTLYLIFVLLLASLTVVFVYSGRSFGNQATSAIFPKIAFNGQYKIADGEWIEYVNGEHIPANKGSVTLKGSFELINPLDGSELGAPSAGTDLAFYLNHIKGSISEDGSPFRNFDTELDVAGEDMCGIMYIGYEYMGGKQITIIFENPHKFGNGSAIDDFLNHLSVYGGTNFENEMLNNGNTRRMLGVIVILCAFMVLGTAVLFMLIRIRGWKKLCIAGFTIFFFGIHLVFSAHGVMFWSEIVKFNTRVLGTSIMLYVLSMQTLIVSSLCKKLRGVGMSILVLSGLTDAAFMVYPAASDAKFFDTLYPWSIIQALCCTIMIYLLIHNFFINRSKTMAVYTLGTIPMVAFIIDTVGMYTGLWQNRTASDIAFAILFMIAIVILLKVIPENVNAAMKTRELEAEKKTLKAELAESRVAIMISQIQPHFIYNTLGTIEQLCISDPDAASKLVHNFSLYLRGNFGELDNPRPIKFSQEINHVKHYTDIEQVRFPDMTIQYDLRSVEFVLPALSVQPLVENAIKHGLMELEEGGIVTVSAYETDDFYVVEVKDDGVGFDTSIGYDETKHVGIKNIRGRIEAMCGGTLTVESKPGSGTKATIKIPKEVKQGEGNNG